MQSKFLSVTLQLLNGLRSKERQAQLVKEKKSTTSNSRHLTGHAVDLAAWVDNTISWEWKYYHQIAKAMKQAADELKISIEWGR